MVLTRQAARKSTPGKAQRKQMLTLTAKASAPKQGGVKSSPSKLTTACNRMIARRSTPGKAPRKLFLKFAAKAKAPKQGGI